MGIHGLWGIIEPTSTEIPLECLEGKKLAVDVSIWIYQAQTAYPSDQPYPHIRLLINRLCKLLYYKIRPVFVFDGINVPKLKKQVLENRRLKKNKDDDVLTNAMKMRHLKQIASGNLTEAQLAKSMKIVLSPSKKVVLNDIYKDIPSTSTNLSIPSEPQMDQMYIQSDDSSSESNDDVVWIENEGKKKEIVEDVEVIESEDIKNSSASSNSFSEYAQNTSRRQAIDHLVEKREMMRNSRLRPTMIPSNSNDFSNFQMQRLLRRGRLNAQIKELTKDVTSSGNDKINVVGPDGTQHVLKYAYSDEIQQIEPTMKRDIECLYKKEDTMDLSLDIFNVQYGGKISRETTPNDFDVNKIEEEEPVKMITEEDFGYQSKSGMLEAIARKRIKQHYGYEAEGESRKRRNLKSSDDEEKKDDSEDEQMARAIKESQETFEIEQSKQKIDTIDEQVEWDPQRFDEPAQQEKFDLDEWTNLEYDEHSRTPELYRDLQEFLTNCGIPWIEAPGEAEAQCVQLENLGLVDGVISDDSDVWAFGVHHVYRHMFSKNRTVQRYGDKSTKNPNCKLFCLEREDFISIALLAGGDYCPGFNKIGAVSALELVAEFVENRSCEQFDADNSENRIMRLLGKVNELLTSPDVPATTRSVMIIRRHAMESNEKETIEMICSNREAVRAYLQPLVNTSNEKFRWRKVNIGLIRGIMHQKLHWSEYGVQNEEKNSIDAFEKWNCFLEAGGVSQMKLDRFFAQPYDEKLVLKWSKKISEALLKISKKSKGEFIEDTTQQVEKKKKSAVKRKVSEDDDIILLEDQNKTSNTVTKVSKRGRGRGRGRGSGVTRGGTKQTGGQRNKLVLSEESSDDSF